MKNTLLIIICLVCTRGFSYPIIETVKTTEKYFCGFIDYHRIDLYLEKVTNSDCVYGIYTVKGWYKIEGSDNYVCLVGLHYYGGLYLYHLNDKEIENEFLEFGYLSDVSSEFKKYDLYTKLEEFDEKITITKTYDGYYKETQKCIWKKESTTLRVNTYGIIDINVENTFNFFHLNKTKSIDLANAVHLLEPIYTLICVSIDCKSIVMGFRAMPRANACGQCGAGDYSGLIQLDFGENDNLIAVKKIVLQSCDEDIQSSKQKITKNKVYYDTVTYEYVPKYRIEVDLKTATINQIEL